MQILNEAQAEGKRMTSNTKANILLVDDHPENLIALEAILSDLNQNLIRASSGEEALKWLLKEDFAVILLDAQMPGMDGFETAMLIKERERSQHTPIIFLTAISKEEEDIYAGYSVGAVDYLMKPFAPHVLRAKVSTFVDIYNKSLEIERQREQLKDMNLELERQLQEVKWLNRELEMVNRELESFSYSVSHDLRSPLRSINGFSQLLLEDYGDKVDDTGKDYLNRMHHACMHMGELIDDLLQLSRVTRSKMQTQTVNLSDLVELITRELQTTDSDRKAEFVIEEDLSTNCDPRLMKVVLENLLGNAWKFTRNHECATIEFGSFTEDSGRLVYFVRDDGAGFDMKYVDRLFGPFQRLHSDSDFEGTGVGLATVQRIIQRHGGQIWAEGAPEQGATFFFTLGA